MHQRQLTNMDWRQCKASTCTIFQEYLVRLSNNDLVLNSHFHTVFVFTHIRFNSYCTETSIFGMMNNKISYIKPLDIHIPNLLLLQCFVTINGRAQYWSRNSHKITIFQDVCFLWFSFLYWKKPIMNNIRYIKTLDTHCTCPNLLL